MSIDRLGDEALRWPRPRDVDGRALLTALREHAGVRDVVVTEDHVAVYFDASAPPAAPWDVRPAAPPSVTQTHAHVVRVAYDGEDLAAIAHACALGEAEVIALHVAPTYEVSMVGFLPGFAYLRGVDPRLALARRTTPRPRVAAGSVAIAAGYTGIYPTASPGGWHILGRAVDFAPWSIDHGALFAIGDRVRFERVG